MTSLIEKAPEGWEDTVVAMKAHTDIDNPYALCLAGDTAIPCLDGQERTLSEIAAMGTPVWVYSLDLSNSLTVAGIAHVREVGLKPALEITLDNEEVLVCSPEHRWILRDGSIVEAGALGEDVSLMPFRRKRIFRPMQNGTSCPTSEVVYHPGLATYTNTHWSVMRTVDPAGCKSGGYVIHHKDENPHNNVPENLQWLTTQQHRVMHGEARKIAAAAGIRRSMANPEKRKRHAEMARERLLRKWREDPEWATKQRAMLRSVSTRGGAAIKARWDNDPEFRERRTQELGEARRYRVAAGNHRVISVRSAGVVPMYDVSVDKWHTFAVAAGVFSHNSHWMANRGYSPKHESGAPRDIESLVRRARHEALREIGFKPTPPLLSPFQREAVGAAQLGALTRKGAKRESAVPRPRTLSWFAPLREATAKGDVPTRALAVLITAGPGNARDGNFYPPEVVQRSAAVFDGAKCFLNHPGVLDEENRPEREVENICGWFSDAHTDSVDTVPAALAVLTYTSDLLGLPTDAGARAKGLVEAAIVYQRQYPTGERVLLGFSINAEGPSHPVPTPELISRYPQWTAELQQREMWNAVDAIDHAESVDLVTCPARGGRVIGLKESLDSVAWRRAFDSEAWRAAFDERQAA